MALCQPRRTDRVDDALLDRVDDALIDPSGPSLSAEQLLAFKAERKASRSTSRNLFGRVSTDRGRRRIYDLNLGFMVNPRAWSFAVQAVVHVYGGVAF